MRIPAPAWPRPRLLVIVLLSVHALLLGWSAYRHSPTMDEPAHLAAGISHWRYGRFDLYSVNPPLVRMVAALPVLAADPVLKFGGFRTADTGRAETRVGNAFIEANGKRIFWLITLARWACIPFSLLGGWFCWRWASEMFGNASGLTALALWCFSPNILGNGALITADMAAAATAVTAGYWLWRWLNERRPGSAFVAGVALGVALLVKSTLILFCGLWPVVWLLYRWSSPEAWRWRELAREAGQVALMLITAAAVLNLGYGCEGSFRPLGEYEFRSHALSGKPDSTWDVGRGNRFRGTLFSAWPVPVPANYLLGIDHQRCDFEGGWKKFFLGEVRNGTDGWWYFYLYGALVKVPLGTWLLALLALATACRHRFRDQLVLLVPGLAILVLVSSQTGLNFFRYLLPAFPFAFVWISQSTSHLRHGARPLRLLWIAAAAWTVGSSLWVYPHSLSYFNELVGGPRNGHRIMIDSNSDWGQDLLYLQDWIKEHPSASGLRLRYYGIVDPEVAGLDVSDVKHLLEEPGRTSRVAPWNEGQPEWYAISVTNLAFSAAPAFEDSAEEANDGAIWCRYLLEREPEGRAGYSILIYRIGRDADAGEQSP